MKRLNDDLLTERIQDQSMGLAPRVSELFRAMRAVFLSASGYRGPYEEFLAHSDQMWSLMFPSTNLPTPLALPQASIAFLAASRCRRLTA